MEYNKNLQRRRECLLSNVTYNAYYDVYMVYIIIVGVSDRKYFAYTEQAVSYSI